MLLPRDNRTVEERALLRNSLPARVSRSWDMGVTNFVFSKYGGTIAFTGAEMLAGGDPSAALATGVGFAASQMVMDATAPAFRGIGRSLGRWGTKTSKFGSLMSQGMGGRVASRGLRGAGGLMRAAGGLSRAIPYIGMASVFGLMLPEGNPIREASDYITGMKFGEWAHQRTQEIKLNKKGGFGVNAPIMKNQRALNARNIAKSLIGQSASVNMLGQEASYMHN